MLCFTGIWQSSNCCQLTLMGATLQLHIWSMSLLLSKSDIKKAPIDYWKDLLMIAAVETIFQLTPFIINPALIQSNKSSCNSMKGLYFTIFSKKKMTGIWVENVQIMMDALKCFFIRKRVSPMQPTVHQLPKQNPRTQRWISNQAEQE